MKFSSKKHKYTLTKLLLSFSWFKFALCVVFAYSAIIVLFFLIFPFFDKTLSFDLKSFLYSLGAIIGAENKNATCNFAYIVLLVEKTIGLILFSIFTAFLITKLSQPRSLVCLADKLGAYWDDGKKYKIKRAKRFLLEFRLIVYPNSPILRPEIMVGLYVTNTKGERDNIPLELTPVQASQVTAYLTFRAILPEEYLIVPEKKHLENKKVPEGIVDIHVKAIDSGSDQPITIFKQYSIPDDVRYGSFKDAVLLGRNNCIKGVVKENLEVITERNE